MNWKEISKKNDDLLLVRKAAAELDVNERDERGRTPLMLFLTNRMPVQAIEILIEHGADLEAEDRLGDTPLKKAVKFKQVDALVKLIEAGAKLDSSQGILATAWNAARTDKKLADLLLETKGAIRLTLTQEEQEIVDEILYEESQDKMCEAIERINSPEILHAIVNDYNWDDGPEPMLSVFHNPAAPEITLLDMYDLVEGEDWMDREDLNTEEEKRFAELAAALNERLELLR
ncbi:hypothetical protein NCCP2222_04210 [Sporosarcina sp. NCCP-2222]|uniref:DUF4274 domain-containing protein n=1 Tax=Sporosarcina sp. NCCP-2222 TaxID=2935073 RepID=UPI0020870D3D|nr:DUF4274 domain-containing protein [Sporosarcina sp. NCCP-2222]GKV54474.1 hypothetical protein NCCP2222_04210 [Sporosarcina sp. NCCP-2222]